MRITPYLNFDGQCEEAFRHYERVLGGRIEFMQSFGDSPMSGEVPPGWHDRILHAHLVVGEAELMASDTPPGQYSPPGDLHVALHLDDASEAERIFHALADGGKVTMPLEKTFWAERFAMLVDRYGIPWTLNVPAVAAGTGTPSDRVVVVTRVFDAPRKRVWDAWTSPDHLPHWMLGPDGWTMPVCEVDLRPGGAWHFAWQRADGSRMEMRGQYREVDAPARLVSTESWGGDWPETLNTVVLTEENSRTTMRLEILYPSGEARDAALGTGMKEGMSLSFDRLADYLGSVREPA